MAAMQTELFDPPKIAETSPPASKPLVAVAINRPFAEPLTYAWPWPEAAIRGSRVLVPLGQQQLVGIVLGPGQPLSKGRLKSVLAKLDTQAQLSDELMQLGEFIGQYYQQPLGEVLHALLPSALRKPIAAQPSQVKSWRLRLPAADIQLSKSARRQQALVDFLATQPEQQATVAHLRLHGFNRQHFNGLASKDLIEQQTQPDWLLGQEAKTLQPPLALNPEQAKVLAALQPETFNAHLVFGVTGSGKTEVYLQAIAQCLARGQQALVLVPEIGLTPQLLSRFSARFSCPIALLHSGMNDQERLNHWLQFRQGHASICIGTRSALFAPAANLGLILVDEEHDGSFKQQDGIRYHGRDLAIKRAQLAQIPIVLGSATPSLESLNNAYHGRMQLHYLRKRAGDAQAPIMEMVDLRYAQLQHGLAEKTLARMDQHLSSGNQVLVYLNRRGYAPSLLCSQCGWLADCPNCDARLVLHKHPDRLQCHHCGWHSQIPSHCPSCASPQLSAIGQGTVRLAEFVEQRFSSYPLVRIDRDNTPSQELTEHLSRIPPGQAGLFLGTQMLAKGHHLPDITLVVVVDGDAGFHGPDFRNQERMAQALVQVAGRAGRGDRLGEVLIQSHYPQHPFFGQLLTQGYESLAKAWLNERAQLGLPPQQALALLRADHKQADKAHDFLQSAKNWLGENGFAGRLLGPVPAPLSKRDGLYRFMLHLHHPSRQQLNQHLRQLQQFLRQDRLTTQISFGIDVDPYDLG